MADYEILYILSTAQTEAQWEASRKYITETITKSSGEIQKEDIWGLRPLASEIKGQRQGYFVHIYFTLPTPKVAEFKFALNIHESMLRFLLTTRIPDPTPKLATTK